MNETKELDVIQALINGVHWGQVLLQEKSKASGSGQSCSLFERGVVELETVQQRAAMFDRLLKALAGNANWRKSILSPDTQELISKLKATPLPADPTLPFHVVHKELSKLTRPDQSLSVLCVANLYQLNLEEHRDGDALQELFKVYISGGFAADLEQLGALHGEKDLQALADRCAASCSSAPFKTDAAYWNLTANRIEMWGEKNSGRRDKFVLARELLADAEIKPLIPKLSELPARRIAFVGYSMMMSINWSSHASWNDIASEALRSINPRYEYAGFQIGGLTAVHALKTVVPPALEYKPTDVFLLMVVDSPEDASAFEAIVRRFQAAGATAHVPDEVRPYAPRTNPKVPGEIKNRKEVCRRTGAHLLNFFDLGKQQPDHMAWECLDTIHMKTVGHWFYAKELLKYFASAPK